MSFHGPLDPNWLTAIAFFNEASMSHFLHKKLILSDPGENPPRIDSGSLILEKEGANSGIRHEI
jgi:hypothetical protein